MQTVRRSRTGWITAVIWLSVVGLIGAIVWGFFGYQGLQHRLAAMPRTAVPGQVAVQVPEPGTLTIYYEDPSAGGAFVVQSSGTNTLSPSPIDITVTGPSGQTVPTTPYQRDLRFDFDGRIATAVATIDASVSGTYTIAVSGTVPATARVSVGDVIDVGLIAGAAGAIILFVASLLALLAMVVVIAIRRARVVPPQEQSTEPTARV